MHQTNEKIHEILFEKDDVTWRSIIYELLKPEEIYPWDIDISLLTKKYIDVVKKLKEFDFNISGKALLAAAILLKIKSNRLVGEDIEELDRIISGEQDEEFFEDDFKAALLQENEGEKILIPRMPQPRKRKVSIYDLMGALEKALEVKQRRTLKNTPSLKIEIPRKKVNINLIIQNLYLRIKRFFFDGNRDLTFSKLIPSDTKEDKVSTIIPLLALSGKQLINLKQDVPFSEIFINLGNKKDIKKEMEKIKEKNSQE